MREYLWTRYTYKMTALQVLVIIGDSFPVGIGIECYSFHAPSGQLLLG